jgi:hypothetical protein
MTGKHVRTALLVALGAVAVAVHLAFGAWAVLAASHWVGYMAAVAVALVALFTVHTAGLRRLRVRGRDLRERGHDHEP